MSVLGIDGEIPKAIKSHNYVFSIENGDVESGDNFILVMMNSKDVYLEQYNIVSKVFRENHDSRIVFIKWSKLIHGVYNE